MSTKTSRFTAAAALLLAIGGGVVGGTLAMAGATDSDPSAPAIVERVNEEAPVPTPSATPDVDSLESELGYPVETAEPVAPAPASQPATQEEPVPNSQPATEQGETASEAADRARREADRAKVEADRAEQVAPKPSPAPIAPKKGCGSAAHGDTRTDDRVGGGGARWRVTETCLDGHWAQTDRASLDSTTSTPKPPSPSLPTEPDDKGEVDQPDAPDEG